MVSCGDGGDNGLGSVDNSTGTVDNSGSDNGICSTAEADNLTQKYLFEVEYMNFAWGPQYNCMYIDRDGQVYNFDLSGMSGPSITKPWRAWQRSSVPPARGS